MNAIKNIIDEAKNHGILLYVKNTKLAYISEKGEMSVELKAQIKDNKAQIIALLLREKEAKQVTEIKIIDKTKPAELSFAQQRLYLVDRLQNGSPEYNMPMLFKVTGNIRLAFVGDALTSIINRHQVLRTVYIEQDEQVKQLVKHEFEFSLTETDLSVMAADAKQQSMQSIIHNEVNTAFDLSQDLMLRANYILLDKGDKDDDQQGVLIINMHHIASDGGSLEIFSKEFFQLYRSYHKGIKASLPELMVQYADFAQWQQQSFNETVLEQQFQYWEQQLDDVPMAHSLPLDRPRRDNAEHTGASYSSQLSDECSASLIKIASKHQITPFMLVHALFAQVLSKNSNCSDTIVGTPITNRPKEQLEPLIGCFLNTLVLRLNTDFSNIKDYLSYVRKTHLDAHANQDMPFERLVERLNIPRSASHNPLFQIMLTNVSNISSMGHQYELNDITLTPLELADVKSKYDLRVNINLTEKGVFIDWVFDTTIFNHDTIVKFNAHFNNVINSFISLEQNPLAVSASDLDILTEQELSKQLYDLNNTECGYNFERTLHELFLERVLISPNSVAVTDAGGSLSYRELLLQSHQVYQNLQTKGIAKQELVAIRAPKGRYQLIACLGIMMAGGAYLPLDVKWPLERCKKICDKAKAQYLITSDSLYGVDNIDTIVIQDNAPQRDVSELVNRYSSSATPDDLAYVIFTSGSTGEPKGVAIEHRSAVNTVLDINAQYAVTDVDKVLAVSSLSFDLSVYDLFGLLAVGGEIVFPTEALSSDPHHWLELIEAHGVTIWDTVPASAGLLAEVLEYQQRSSTAPLRNILMSGDWIEPSLPKRLWDVFEQVNIYSLGGATEGSIWSIHYPILSDMTGRKSVPYGKPLSNQRFYILDNQQNLMPMGTVGELYIGGVGVARGYYRAEQLSAQRFFYHNKLEQKLYRTGDLGRYLADGNIEFIGRIDDQVKIRGFRVELGEIECVLNQHPSINSTLVQAKDMGRGKQLVAYVTLAASQAGADHNELIISLKQQLNQVLPSYMVPDTFLVLNQWPLTANGKIDKKSLPEPDTSLLLGEYVAPVTETEHLLVQIWSELLEIDADKISTTANFFELGGHSLLLMKFLSRLKSKGSQLEPQVIFAATSLGQLATEIDNLGRETQIENNIYEQATSKSANQIEELVL